MQEEFGAYPRASVPVTARGEHGGVGGPAGQRGPATLPLLGLFLTLLLAVNNYCGAVGCGAKLN